MKEAPKKGDAKQQQAQGGEGEQYGEGNYKATRDYNRGMAIVAGRSTRCGFYDRCSQTRPGRRLKGAR